MVKKPRQWAADEAYRHIRRRIFRGELAPGDSLIEQDLAAEIGVSRTPVRAALHRLETEGLVYASGNRRAMVREFAEAEVDECFELRALLESYAAGRAATAITPAGLAELKDLSTQMEAVVAEGGEEAPVKFATLNDQFHDGILWHCGSQRLRDLIKPLVQVQLVLMQRFRPHIEMHLQRSCWHHREIIAALEARDPAWAETQMRTHLLSAKNPAVDGA
ncbi:MAG: GntR family transcriptional regulator [Rhodospirillaceae bacterium]|nr:GntR family transcriptional regulator [Rhodospirillaceae bacterium]